MAAALTARYPDAWQAIPLTDSELNRSSAGTVLVIHIDGRLRIGRTALAVP
jgi:hypothetical protein